MPAFIGEDTPEYKVMVRPDDYFRRFIRFKHHYLLPYFYGSHILLKLIVKPKVESEFKTINYKWNLTSLDGKVKFTSPSESIELLANNRFETRIVTDLVKQPTLYELELKVSKSNGEIIMDKTVALLTVKDRDEFYLNMLWILFGFVLGAISVAIGLLV